MSILRALFITTLCSVPFAAIAEDASTQSQAAKLAIVAAKAPDSMRWTQPAEFAFARASDDGKFETLDFAIEWSKQFAVTRDPSNPTEISAFHKVSVAPYWAHSSKEKGPVNDRGLTLAHVYQPGSACLQSRPPDCLEWKIATSVSAGRTQTEIAAEPKTYADTTQLTAKSSVLLSHPAWSSGYHYFSTAAGAYYDRRNKPTSLVPNGTEAGLYLRPEVTILPFGLMRKDEAGTVEIKLTAQYQQGLDANGARSRENHRWFKAQIVMPFGSLGDGSDKWYPSLSLQRYGGEDATQAEPRRYQSRLAFQLKVGI
jgi:hypothetical protein